MHGVEELHLGHEEGVDRPCGVDEVVTREADETVADELGRNEPVSRHGRLVCFCEHEEEHSNVREDANGGVHRNVVV